MIWHFVVVGNPNLFGRAGGSGSDVQFLQRAICAYGFPIHARSRRFSPVSPVSSCLQNWFVVLYVMWMFGPYNLKGYPWCMPR